MPRPAPAGRRPAGAGAVAKRRGGPRPRVGLALAGGGPLGAIYEIGALCALEEALPGLHWPALDGYVGVSAGAFLAAGLANGMAPRELCAAFIDPAPGRDDAVDAAAFIRPAWGEFARRAAMLPRALRDAALAMRPGRSWWAAAEALGRVLPAGVFGTAPLEHELARVLTRPGRHDDFRRLARRLVIVATDLDAGTAATFGAPGLDHVPISRAVAASAALPGLFPPVAIDGRWYVDGALKKTLHAGVLLDQGMDLVFCLNPLVPFDATRPRWPKALARAEARIPRLVEGGLPVVLSQTFRTLIHSRLELGLRGYASSHPGTDIVLLEPDHRDAALFFANVFGYRGRQRLAEHAYQRTRADLRQRRATLAGVLARHGLALDDAALDDRTRTLLGAPAPALRDSAAALVRLAEVLEDLSAWLARSGGPTPPAGTPLAFTNAPLH